MDSSIVTIASHSAHFNKVVSTTPRPLFSFRELDLGASEVVMSYKTNMTQSVCWTAYAEVRLLCLPLRKISTGRPAMDQWERDTDR